MSAELEPMAYRHEITYSPRELTTSLGISRSTIDQAMASGRLVPVRDRGFGFPRFSQGAIGAWLDAVALDLEVAMLGGPAQISRAWLEAPPAVRVRVRPAALATALGTLAQGYLHAQAGLGPDGNPWEQAAIQMTLGCDTAGPQ